MAADSAIEISACTHRYGTRVAVDQLSLSIAQGEVFVFLGPNGSGKTTLFRVLSTLIPLQEGEITILDNDLRRSANAIRSKLGVVFQAPSLDKKLSVAENLHHQGKLYGLGGKELKSRIDQMLTAVGIADRAGDLTETLSGGMRRRVELAKGLLHRPQLLLLDEPSTGLDPGARSDLWKYLHQIRESDGVTIVLTTHLLEEAERADRIAIMHTGKLAALDTPAALQASVGGDAITIRTPRPTELADAIRVKFNCDATVLDGSVRLEQPEGHQWIARLVEAFPEDIEAITLGKPTLEDVFIDRTGHRFWNESQE
ncbi:ABC transporter ATP-binding protein [Bythopirellula goksoeyrii]|uniref:Daunorubicin/doxorubicin resistance ATP-binding protein DrrA n=1 Tax=Bythopirellula goksoeyrii TaxID=1400387 RepID=A0A5B9QH50_9BACT|nr:ABC transporter ATP-binding protein [Bythopirellula goksoeyrii]QEG36975.1 Daunorubicin/doxorubicin resistance ATP-binding protein DrrA [Bythopirellula goksoeyrii]